MTTLQRCLGFLNQNPVHYVHIQANAYRASEVVAAEYLPHNLAKTVIFYGDGCYFYGDGCYAMAVLPADSMMDLEELAARLAFTSIRLATEAEVGKLFPNCEMGAIPPLGRLFNLPVYLDVSLTYRENIVFYAGSHRDSIYMRARDFIRLIDPNVTSFTRASVRLTKINSGTGVTRSLTA